MRRLLEQRYEFQHFVANPAWYQMSGRAAMSDLASVEPSWQFDTLSGLEPATVNGKQVLITARQHPGSLRD